MKIKKTIAAIISGLCMIGSTSYMPINTNYNQIISNAEEENEISVWDGTTYDTSWYDEDETEFHLSSVSQFAGFVKIINVGRSMSDVTIHLDIDIDFNNKDIDTIKTFDGKFDGHGHVIRSVNKTFIGINKGTIHNCSFYLGNSFKYENASNQVTGIVCNTNNGTLSNCQLFGRLRENSTIKGTNYLIGGICGELVDGNIRNCKSSVERIIQFNHDSEKKTSDFYIGGICGKSTSSKIENCIFDGKLSFQVDKPIEGKIIYSYGPPPGYSKSYMDYYYSFDINDIILNLYIGGICGYSVNTKISKCKNKNNIPASLNIKYKKTEKPILDNNNYINRLGDDVIKGKSKLTDYNGGICGYMTSSSDISNCSNYGNTSAGICGFAKKSNITDVYNRGSVESGICCTAENCLIKNSYNSGKANNIVGRGQTTKGENCYYSSTSSITSGGIIEAKIKTEKSMMTEDFAELLGDKFIYVQDDFPILKWELTGNILSFSEKNMTINDFNKSPKIELSCIIFSEITWISSNPEVASVDSNGVITPVNNGNTKIYAICGDMQAVCDVIVNAYVLNQKQVSLNVNENTQIMVNQNGNTIESSKVVFTSSNPKVATVDENGLVTGIKAGICTISATIEDVELIIKVTINAIETTTTVTTTAPPSPTIDKPTVSIKSGEKSEIKIMNYNGDITWLSSDSKIATVTKGKNNTATIEGIAAGSAKIYAMISGGKNLTCEVEVSEDGEANIKYGDANCDNKVDLSDAVLIMQSISNPSKYGEKGSDKTHITTQGLKNGDVSGNGDGVTNKDALAIQKYMLQLITKLPE